MPELKDFRKIETIELPSFPDSKIEVYDRLIFGDMLVIENIESDTEKNILMIARLIKSWNLTDDKEVVLPVTPENIKKLPLKDSNVLTQKLTSALEIKKKE